MAYGATAPATVKITNLDPGLTTARVAFSQGSTLVASYPVTFAKTVKKDDSRTVSFTIDTQVSKLPGTWQAFPGMPDGAAPDLATLQVQVGDESVTATADLASNADEQDTIQRTAVLAIDASQSMRGERFAAAQEAARAFVGAAPDDVAIGLVSFSGLVREVQPPTTDHDAVLAAVDDLSLDTGTLLYPGIEQALEVAGSEGSRSVLVLSDGRDTTGSAVMHLLAQVERSQVQLDVVSLELGQDQLAVLGDLAAAGGGTSSPPTTPRHSPRCSPTKQPSSTRRSWPASLCPRASTAVTSRCR